MKTSKVSLSYEGQSFYIAGIGSSAGGLDALTEMFENMPDNTGIAFVVIQHVSPDHKSLMAELIGKHTNMVVTEAIDNMPVKPNHIYVIPPRHIMTISKGRLQLETKIKNNIPNNAIDIFFESLANDAGSKAIGVIVSGTGTDGVKGIESIKKCEGTVVVQDPLSAGFDGMPNSAIATGMADLIAPPEMIGEEILEYIHSSPAIRIFHNGSEQDDLLIGEILHLVKNHTELDFSYYKRPTILRRLAKRLSEVNIHQLDKYLAHLHTHPDEMEALSREFLINVSSFFRDKEAFDVLETEVLPAIFKEKNSGDTIKIWTIACSTGEEAYSIAILFKEFMERNRFHDITIKLFATDIDRDALEIAAKGIYPKSILQDISGPRIAKYFVPEGNSYRIHPDVRKMVVFSNHDILRDPPFSKMDFISCRNMLIYVNPQQQKDILRKIYFALNLHGFLFFGPSENTGILNHVVEPINKRWKIFRCITKTSLHEKDSHFFQLERKIMARIQQPKVRQVTQHLHDIFAETILTSDKHAGIFITPEMEVKHAVGNYKAFIEFPDQEFNFNLLKLVPTELSIALGVAIRKCLKENATVNVPQVNMHSPAEKSVRVIVRSFLQNKEYNQPFLFVVLSELETTPAERSTQHTDQDGHQRIIELEHELYEVRAEMQSLIEEMEAANEELQAANEEMISGNEELQSTNEELQSLNEELHTVSAEHQARIRELTLLNDDLNNYFRNTDIGQLLIDRNLIIRRFSPAISRMINLIDSDVNRSILDITTRLKEVDFVTEVRHVIKYGLTTEKEVTLHDGSVCIMRINPYIRSDKSMDGVVINFIDITEFKSIAGIIQGIYETSPNAIDVKKAVINDKRELIDFEYITVNKAFQDLFRQENHNILGKKLKELARVQSLHFDFFKKVFESKQPAHFEFYDDHLEKWLELHVSHIPNGLVTTTTDITIRKKAVDLLSQSYQNLKATTGQLAASNKVLENSNQDLMQFASVASHDLKEPLRKIETFGNLLQHKLQDRFEKEELHYLDKIINASQRMKSLIDDILLFAKMTGTNLRMEEVDLNTVIQRVSDDLEIPIREKNAQLIVGDLPAVRAVKIQMHQLFQNLLSNALKFNDKDKPVIAIESVAISKTLAQKLNISVKDFTAVRVKDNGIGFQDQYNEKIFGLFQRLHGSKFEGTGIGLAIGRKIIENHNGFITVESKPGKGTEFTVVFPKN